MQHLFCPDGETALAFTLQQRPLLAFDFDGTLTPIVARPNDVRLSSAVATRLASLATHLPVAIVTGRSVGDVRGRLGFAPRFIVGNHGAEDESDMAEPGQPSAAMMRQRQRIRDHGAALDAVGVTVEDKGQSIALHYRLARNRGLALQMIEDVLAGRDGELHIFGGKLVVNVTSRHAPDKADAVQNLVRRSGASCAIFAGDDVNDEPVFTAAPASWLTIRIGRDMPKSGARFFLDSPAEMAMLLERMISLLAARR
ncbi:MAG: trehalose-phosphatase [Burkholderiales bacterium 28-67-8]|nr:MAG: trehalose-phosphatase [Burkholderiales bacterium 28-67-8]